MQIKSATKYFWVFVKVDLKTNMVKNRSESNMIKDRPGGRRFHKWLLSRKQHTVGKQITIGKLIEDRIIMTISKAMINIQASRPRLVDRLLPASTTITPHIDRYPACIQCIKFMENGVMQ